MWPDVEENACAGCWLLAPGVRTTLRAKAVVGGLEANNAAERAGGDDLQNGLEVAVVAAILVHGEQSSGSLRELYELDSFVERAGEGLVDEDITSCGETLMREGAVRLVGRGDDDQANAGNGKQFVEAADNARVRICGGSLGAAALQNR